MDMDVSPEQGRRKKLSRSAPSDPEIDASAAVASTAADGGCLSLPPRPSTVSSSSQQTVNPAKKAKPSPSPVDIHPPPAGTPSNEFEQLNFDEGYSGEKTPTPQSENPQSSLAQRENVKIPLWMTGLQPDIREGGSAMFVERRVWG